MNKVLFLKSKKKEKIMDYLYINGGALLEELITTFGPRYKIPIRHLSASEILSATNSYRDCLDITDSDGSMCLGSLERRPILVKKYTGTDRYTLQRTIRDIAVNSQMSHHKNVLKLVGCCLEFDYPALVYEFAGTKLLSHGLFGSPPSTLSWRSRLRIAIDVASVIAYLHEAFPTPIVFRAINPTNIIINQHGVAKLFGFSISISLPPGEDQVEDIVCGTVGYLDPSYFRSAIVTQKTDVFSLGMLLLVILTRREPSGGNREEFPFLLDRVIDRISKDELEQIVDPEILGEGGGVEKRQQIHAFLHLALRCMVFEVEDRPLMVDVAKQLLQIERYPHQLPSAESIWSSIKLYSLRDFTWPAERVQ